MTETAEERYFPGLEGVIAGETAISTLTGGLQYRGYAIMDLAQGATVEEVAYLLLWGELPNGTQLRDFSARIAKARAIPEPVATAIAGLPKTAAPMDVLRSAVSLLAHFDPDTGDNSHDANLRKAERLFGQIPLVIAHHHRVRSGQKPLSPRDNLGHAANVLYLLTGREPGPAEARAMDLSLILYAEHEFNASTFSARVTVSTLSDLHSGITSAIGTLKGPLHGGANERVMEMLQKIESPAEADRWIRDALARKERVMGFGHRVYKTGDPRAEIIRSYCQELARQTGQTKYEEIADRIENVIRSEKKLPPNIDWPSGRLYYYMGLPIDLYTPIFVVSRVAGWSAHVIEQLDNNRLIRPLARYTGPTGRKFVPLDKRG